MCNVISVLIPVTVLCNFKNNTETLTVHVRTTVHVIWQPNSMEDVAGLACVWIRQC